METFLDDNIATKLSNVKFIICNPDMVWDIGFVPYIDSTSLVGIWNGIEIYGDKYLKPDEIIISHRR